MPSFIDGTGQIPDELFRIQLWPGALYARILLLTLGEDGPYIDTLTRYTNSIRKRQLEAINRGYLGHLEVVLRVMTNSVIVCHGTNLDLPSEVKYLGLK